MKTLSEIRELLGKISPWPWSWRDDKVISQNREMVCEIYANEVVADVKFRRTNQDFIAASPEIISSLLDRLEEAEGVIGFYADLKNYRWPEALVIKDWGETARAYREKWEKENDPI